MARCTLMFQRPIPGFEPSPESYVLAESVLTRAVNALQRGRLEARGRRRLLRRDGRRPHRRPDQQRPRWRPLDLATSTGSSTCTSMSSRTGGFADDAEPDRTPRGPSARRGGVRALRRRDRCAHPRRVGAPDRLRGVGRPPGRAARPRLGRRAGVVPAVRAPAAARRAAQQGDRLAPLGRRDERAADPRALASLQRRARGRSSRPSGPRRSRVGGAPRFPPGTCRSRSAPRSAGRR